MKTSQNNTLVTRGRRFRLSCVSAMSLGIAASGWPVLAHAENVDSEIVLLVDIVRPELSTNEFNRLLDGYANTFSSSQVLDSIQSGAFGRIAVSMMLYGGAGSQVIGIPWMSIGSVAEAANFASLVRNVNRPSTFAYSDAGSALTAATGTFGSETGGAGNGFESAVQIIEVASAGLPSTGMAAATAASSSNALSAGVDLINAIALGNFASSIETFYATNVVGSALPGVVATTNSSAFNSGLSTTLSGVMAQTVQTGATASLEAVPEPSSITGLIPATLLLLKRRRR